MKKLRLIILKVAVSAVILYFLFRNVDFKLFRDMFIAMPLLNFVGAALTLLTVAFVSTYRWSRVVKRDVVISYRELLSIYFIGMFFNSFLPTAVGGDFVKGYYLFKRSGKAAASFASIFVDRYSGFAAMIFIEGLALIASYGVVYRIGGTGLLLVFIFFIAGFVMASLFMWVKFLHGWLITLFARIHFYKLNDKIDGFYKVFMSYKGKGLLIRIFLISIVVQCGVSFSYFILGRGLGIDAPIGYYFLFVPMATSAAMIPLSLAGLGIREGVFIFLFTGVGVSREEALGLSLLWFITTVVISLPGAVEYIRTGGKKPPLLEAAADI
ncbi:hypothetical protein MNBD_DELTA02-306 [hydrothermal vent metagenome]|uniref:Flippase-like domain-containing protein n=1 Tax=hydrothermal vent metagenome TaxID=652676 RepID=A0A3B0UXW0_9ZZZZ